LGNHTFAIIKPDAVKNKDTGLILDRILKADFQIMGGKLIHMSIEQAQGFYAIHKDKPFFDKLVNFMISGPVIVQVLEWDNAISKNREIMGATNPDEAKNGTIRKDFARSIDENAVHGSDAVETANIEIKYFFDDSEICERTR